VYSKAFNPGLQLWGIEEWPTTGLSQTLGLSQLHLFAKPKAEARG